jgi:uncharacterized protein
MIDTTGTPTQVKQLETQLTTRLNSTHGSQVVVLMVPPIAPEDIASYANRVVHLEDRTQG